MNLATARSELQDIIGADLDDTEADRLLNDGYKELCVRAEWRRATLALGNTVVGQSAYEMPGEVYRPLRLKVNGTRYEPSDEDMVDDVISGVLRLTRPGVWWLSHSADGAEEFSIYPTPTTAGLPITALCVVIPDPIEEDADFFLVPQDYHQAPVYFAAARSLGGSEDDLEARAVYMDQFDGLVGRLKRLRRSRTGSGPVNMRIVGQTA